MWITPDKIRVIIVDYEHNCGAVKCEILTMNNFLTFNCSAVKASLSLWPSDFPNGIPSAKGIPSEGASKVIHIKSLRDYFNPFRIIFQCARGRCNMQEVGAIVQEFGAIYRRFMQSAWTWFYIKTDISAQCNEGVLTVVREIKSGNLWWKCE